MSDNDNDNDNDTDSAGSLDSDEIRDLFDDPMPKSKDSLDDNNLMSTRYKPSISGKIEIPWVEKYRPKKLDYSTR
jgi:hypothetical protein